MAERWRFSAIDASDGEGSPSEEEEDESASAIIVRWLHCTALGLLTPNKQPEYLTKPTLFFESLGCDLVI